MKNSPLLIYDLIIFFVELLLAMSSLYSALINLFQNKISNIGFDAFVLLFLGKRKATMIRKDARIIKRIGVFTLLMGIGAANEAVSIFIQNIWPYVH